jgi:hypothetical protein
MSLASRLAAMTTLIARALIALAALADGLRRRRGNWNYFFMRFRNLYFAFIVMTV